MESGVLWGIVFGVLSCASYTAAAVTQRGLAVRVAEPLTHGRSLAALLRHPLWWSSLLFNGGRAGFQVAAVSQAPLTVVQPLGVLVLVFGVPWSARNEGRRVSAAEWRGVALTSVALGVPLAVAVTGGGGGVLDDTASLVVGCGTTALLVATAWLSGRVRSVAWRSHLLAGAAGTAFGVSSATAKTSVVVIGESGATGLLHASSLATPVIAVLGLFLAQAAYQGMELGAPLGVTTFTNPLSAAVVGVVFMGESYTGGRVGLLVAAVCALVAAYGIRLLTAPETGEGGRAPRARGPETVS
ncbi:DMT family transporter [Nocardiopsis sp. ATB16-24]|uniref:DMT family transporter n=1 Tax=Nocardiopsis sp. ATB16-24 TaxID=3019555 RepID=UPI0025565B5D|nr:DMT family transporter [Nocardiopsis sp. ATB16-24]